MLMRVAVGIHKRDIDAAIETYNLLSEKWFTHASPTLFNAGTNRPQLSRPGAFAVYLEPWHADVFEFLELKKNTGKEEQRARDLFFALWIPDLFMKRVESNQVNPEGNVAVCNLASIALNMYVTSERSFDFKKLASVTKVIVRNLNKIIDINYYPVPEAEKSNKRHRPIGIGVQGLADAFILMRYPFESPEAQLLNIHIFETIYYAALEASCELAAEFGPYETYAGSPVSKGVSSFQTSI
ncbi:hypothetical protein GOODEAATRI_002988 [Goodea atripinnis]|uniref:Ribonucleoside-diphosphate reductase n=1 Tax=Goodea atripinnis TaxID=208336 RepID=A0ABV0NSH3_9TELE